MKIRALLYLLFFCASLAQAQRQSVLNNVQDLLGYEQIPQEKLFIHYNSTVLFSGEYLYYKVYCINSKNNRLSTISKIAYVELINENKTPVFRHKVKLDDGLGQGDFFLPVSVPSGNYKLIGYTQWMLNSKQNIFFQDDISILNPYQGDQKNIFSSTSNDVSGLSLVGNTNSKQTERMKIDTSENIDLILDKEIFQKRSLVGLTINTSDNATLSGNYSISVKKKNSFGASKRISAKEFSVSQLKTTGNVTKSIQSSIFLPEMRGELIYGKIIPTEANIPISSVQVALSIPGDTENVKVVATNDEGIFVFNLNKIYATQDFVFQILGPNKKMYRIELDEMPEVTYPDLDFYKFNITKELKDDITKRSIHNQIDNSFYSIKPDTIQEVKQNIPFYGSQYDTYTLDEYTRFATIKETIVEIVDNVWTESDSNGEKKFAVRGYYPTQEDNGYKPLVIIDGIVEQDHELLMEYDARKVKRISFVRDRYFLGTKIFEGILIFETLKGDYLESLDTRSDVFKINLIRPLEHKKYYKQAYTKENDEYDRIPDFRHQLFWEPNITLDTNSTGINFYTSDTIGDYEISIEGFTNQGVPVSLKKEFKVE